MIAIFAQNGYFVKMSLIPIKINPILDKIVKNKRKIPYDHLNVRNYEEN